MNIRKLKYVAMFTTGLLTSAIAVYAAGTTTIDTNLDNAVQYIKKIVITDATGNTGIILDGNGNASMSGHLGINRGLTSNQSLSEELNINGNVLMLFPNTWMGTSEKQLVFGNNGRIGIGTYNPQAALQVSGAIIVGNDTTCNTGAIIFSGDTHFYGCNGITWKQLDN